MTVKDCLKYQFKVEASGNPRDDRSHLESQEKLWGVLKMGAVWISDQVSHVSRGKIRLGSDAGAERVRVTGSLDERGVERRDSADDGGVELVDR